MMCYGDDVGIFSSGELVNVRVWGGMLHRLVIVSARFDGVGAWRVRINSAVFYVAEIVAAKMLLFFRNRRRWIFLPYGEQLSQATSCRT